MSALGNRQIMAQNIQYYMALHGKSRNDICEAIGVKYTTFTDWVKGNSYPRIDKIELMANYFGISKADLVEDRSSTVTASTGAVRIPVYGYVAAGLPIVCEENKIDWEEIPEAMAHTGEYFGVQVKGQSMEPRILEGDVVIVRQQNDAESGDIVIAQVNGDEATCKRLKKYADYIELISNNPYYPPMKFTNEEIVSKPVKILGKVVELRGKL